jgi:uncharacterized protein (DUF1778 family)
LNKTGKVEKHRSIAMSATSVSRHKETRLSIRASDTQKALLTQAAEARNMNISQFVLQASLDAAHAVLIDQTEFRLPADKWEEFCQRLDEPARIIPELEKLFRETGPF